jgi:hypothetical protein
MPGSWSLEELPHLTEDACEITSPVTKQYNCIAWAAQDAKRYWWPDPWRIGYWPPGVPRKVTIAAFVQAFEKQGYASCPDGSPEEGMEKIAIFGKESQDGAVIPTHASRQLESGEWTSKLGPLEDVSHRSIHSVNGPLYGKPVCYMSRPRAAPESD